MKQSIDSTVLAGYNAGIERNRLNTGIGRIEFAYTKELLTAHLPPPPAVIYDVGGGYGEYAWWLTSLGYEVHLFDLSDTNIAMSASLSERFSGYSLHAAEVCDARDIPRTDNSADAILLMGPLYHITEYPERIAAIKEMKRLLHPGGVLCAAALTPYSVLLHCITVYRTEHSAKSHALDNSAFLSMVERELHDGHHENPNLSVYHGLGTSHLHTAAMLRAELSDGGFPNSEIHGVMGGAWLAHDIDALWEDPDCRETLMKTVRLLDGHEEIIGLSGHLLAIAENRREESRDRLVDHPRLQGLSAE